ncbi:hypothetical protein B9Z65_273 [Elsinoe australis]|uniref:Uncharacterized protein n=1 Tax=Elsinoe australis TaxID=40998 RepID=A0A2P7ZQ39_9PEZI|nr:hypothetical protein B9Z65_273 [Elsinoe australis]
MGYRTSNAVASTSKKRKRESTARCEVIRRKIEEHLASVQATLTEFLMLARSITDTEANNDHILLEHAKSIEHATGLALAGSVESKDFTFILIELECRARSLVESLQGRTGGTSNSKLEQFAQKVNDHATTMLGYSFNPSPSTPSEVVDLRAFLEKAVSKPWGTLDIWLEDFFEDSISNDLLIQTIKTIFSSINDKHVDSRDNQVTVYLRVLREQHILHVAHTTKALITLDNACVDTEEKLKVSTKQLKILEKQLEETKSSLQLAERDVLVWRRLVATDVRSPGYPEVSAEGRQSKFSIRVERATHESLPRQEVYARVHKAVVRAYEAEFDAHNKTNASLAFIEKARPTAAALSSARLALATTKSELEASRFGASKMREERNRFMNEICRLEATCKELAIEKAAHVDTKSELDQAKLDREWAWQQIEHERHQISVWIENCQNAQSLRTEAENSLQQTQDALTEAHTEIAKHNELTLAWGELGISDMLAFKKERVEARELVLSLKGMLAAFEIDEKGRIIGGGDSSTFSLEGYLALKAENKNLEKENALRKEDMEVLELGLEMGKKELALLEGKGEGGLKLRIVELGREIVAQMWEVEKKNSEMGSLLRTRRDSVATEGGVKELGDLKGMVRKSKNGIAAMRAEKQKQGRLAVMEANEIAAEYEKLEEESTAMRAELQTQNGLATKMQESEMANDKLKTKVAVMVSDMQRRDRLAVMKRRDTEEANKKLKDRVNSMAAEIQKKDTELDLKAEEVAKKEEAVKKLKERVGGMGLEMYQKERLAEEKYQRVRSEFKYSWAFFYSIGLFTSMWYLIAFLGWLFRLGR